MQDMVGLGNALAFSKTLYDDYRERFKASPVLKRKFAANHISRKAERGWFEYK